MNQEPQFALDLADECGGQRAVLAACLLSINYSNLTAKGQEHGTDVAPLLALHRQCVTAWARDADVSIGDINTALVAMRGRQAAPLLLAPAL